METLNDICNSVECQFSVPRSSSSCIANGVENAAEIVKCPGVEAITQGFMHSSSLVGWLSHAVRTGNVRRAWHAKIRMRQERERYASPLKLPFGPLRQCRVSYILCFRIFVLLDHGWWTHKGIARKFPHLNQNINLHPAKTFCKSTWKYMKFVWRRIHF